MDANLINQFILAANSVFTKVANVSLKKKKLDFHREGAKFYADLASIIGITGALKGLVVLSLSESIAIKFASAILSENIEKFDELAESGTCEMINMIAGEASRLIHSLGYSCDLSIPSMIRGQMLEIAFAPHSPVFSVLLESAWGEITLIIKLEVQK